jgi:3-dehydroquinate dehydratase/shikimate dehydrogenase
VIANRSVARAAVLAGQLSLPARSCSLEDLASGAVRGDVLANTTSVGMTPNDHDTPVPAAVLGGFKLVFDAVYTPRHTRLLTEAAAAGCAVVTGDEMFVGQAAEQFGLFTGLPPPVELMRGVVLESLGEAGK